jgi:hypothetical protein
MAVVTATLGGVNLPLDPDQVGWRATTKTRSQNTVGGKVVQAYGTSVSEINIIGSYGKGGFEGEQAFLTQVSSWINQQVGTLSPQLGQGVWNGTPLNFIFPFRNWNMSVYIVKFYNPEAGQSIFVDPRTVNYHWALTLYVASNNGTLTAADPTLDASMIQYINRLSTYFGWFPTQANGPVQPGQYPALVQSTLTAQDFSGSGQ